MWQEGQVAFIYLVLIIICIDDAWVECVCVCVNEREIRAINLVLLEPRIQQDYLEGSQLINVF